MNKVIIAFLGIAPWLHAAEKKAGDTPNHEKNFSFTMTLPPRAPAIPFVSPERPLEVQLNVSPDVKEALAGIRAGLDLNRVSADVNHTVILPQHLPAIPPVQIQAPAQPVQVAISIAPETREMVEMMAVKCPIAVVACNSSCPTSCCLFALLAVPFNSLKDIKDGTVFAAQFAAQIALQQIERCRKKRQ